MRNKWYVAILPVRSGMESESGTRESKHNWLGQWPTTSIRIVINLCHAQTTGGSRTLCWHKFQGSFPRFFLLFSIYTRTFIFSRQVQFSLAAPIYGPATTLFILLKEANQGALFSSENKCHFTARIQMAKSLKIWCLQTAFWNWFGQCCPLHCAQECLFKHLCYPGNSSSDSVALPIPIPLCILIYQYRHCQ